MTKNFTLFFSILAAGFFMMTFIGVVFLIKQILYSPKPEVPDIYKTVPKCVIDEQRERMSSSTPETTQEPYKTDPEAIKKAIEELEIKNMSEQLKEAEKQMKLLEEQINEKITP